MLKPLAPCHSNPLVSSTEITAAHISKYQIVCMNYMECSNALYIADARALCLYQDSDDMHVIVSSFDYIYWCVNV